MFIITNGVWFYSQSAADPVHQIGPWTKRRDDADVVTRAEADALLTEWRRAVRGLRIEENHGAAASVHAEGSAGSGGSSEEYEQSAETVVEVA